MSTTDTTLTAAQILAALTAAGITDAHVEQTGGNCATIFAGPLTAGRHALAIGPGVYDWANPAASTFDTDDLYVGPDDDGEADPTICYELSAVVAAARGWLL